MYSKEELIWKLVKDAKAVEETKEFLNHLRDTNIGTKLFVRCFWNREIQILTINGTKNVVVEVRTEHEQYKGEKFLILLTEKQKIDLWVVDQFTYLFVEGKKRKQYEFMSYLPVIEVEIIRKEDILHYYVDDWFIKNFDITKIMNLLHEFWQDNYLTERTIINLLNTPVEGTGRYGKDVPLVFTCGLDKRAKYEFIDTFKKAIFQLMDEPATHPSIFKVGSLIDKKIDKNVNWLISGIDIFGLVPNHPIIRKADAPILIKNPSTDFSGIALKNFENDDLSYLKIFRKIYLIQKSKISDLDTNQFDKSYVESFIDVSNDLPPKERYPYLGLSIGDRILSTNLSIDYGRKLNLTNTFIKDGNKSIYKNFDTLHTFGGDLVIEAIRNKTLIDLDNQVYKDGINLDKKGYGSLRRDIAKIREIIIDGGGYSINQDKFREDITSKISFVTLDNLEKHGLLLRRLNNEISLHPKLF